MRVTSHDEAEQDLVEPETIKVIALAHHHRHPDHWKHRLDEIND